MASAVADQISKLEAARQLVLGDATHYSVIIPGILPIIGARAQVEIRRWGAEFLSEAFANPLLQSSSKETLGVQVLQTLRELLEVQAEDEVVVKGVIQTAASIYPPVFRYITNNPTDKHTWDIMAVIKSNILKRWDKASIGVKVCCIKFAQRVVHTQTPGVIADPRRPEKNEISSALVPRDHPLIPQPLLEAEASGLLDRILSVFQEGTSDAVLINATLNCLGVLVRTRPSIANKVVSAVLNFNPLKLANGSMTPKSRVQIKSMERTTRAFLLNIYKRYRHPPELKERMKTYKYRNENGPFAARIKQHAERLNQSRIEMFDEGGRKRAAPTEAAAENAKRARVGPAPTGKAAIPPLPPGPNSIAQLYTLTTEEALKSFDVAPLPIDLIVRITVPLLQRIDQNLLNNAINAIRARYLEVEEKAQNQAPMGEHLTSAIDGGEDDDYEPTFEPQEDLEQISNRLDAAPSEPLPQKTMTDLAIGPFKLPQPPPMSEEEAQRAGQGTISRVFSMMSVIEDHTKAAPKAGLNRLAGSRYDKDAWVTVICRLATRASNGLEGDEIDGDDEKKSMGTAVRAHGHTLSDGIRETLWKFIIEDFRVRIHVAISWLNEEWYNDRMVAKEYAQARSRANGSGGRNQVPLQNYGKWLLKTLDGIIPYLDAKDKVLIRFLSEVPELGDGVLQRVKGLARDPDRVSLAVNALHYLVLLRPPIREEALDTLEDLWKNFSDAKVPAQKVLMKWRPQLWETKPANGTQTQERPISSGIEVANRLKSEGSPPHAVAASG